MLCRISHTSIARMQRAAIASDTLHPAGDHNADWVRLEENEVDND